MKIPKRKFDPKVLSIKRQYASCFVTLFASFLIVYIVRRRVFARVIIGVLCYIGCKMLNIPYASIAGVVIGCTNIIPIFGPIIGAAIAGVLILLVSPIKAIVFIVFSLILQQLESNLIYPKVVGESIGLSALWVLFAVTLGGGLFGIVGMIFGLPAFSIVYELLRRWTNQRLSQKQELGN